MSKRKVCWVWPSVREIKWIAFLLFGILQSEGVQNFDDICAKNGNKISLNGKLMHLLPFWPTVNSSQSSGKGQGFELPLASLYTSFLGVCVGVCECEVKQMKCISGAAPATGAFKDRKSFALFGTFYGRCICSWIIVVVDFRLLCW